MKVTAKTEPSAWVRLSSVKFMGPPKSFKINER